MPAPTLVHFEQQIDAELHQGQDETVAIAIEAKNHRGVADGQEDGTQSELASTGRVRRRPAAIEVDWMSLDEMVSVLIMNNCILLWDRLTAV